MISVTAITESWCKKNQIPFEKFESIDSTNNEAKRNIKNDPTPLKIILAKNQTSGRGRGQNVWLNTDKDTSLLMSWVLHLKSPPQITASPLVGLCLIQAVRAAWPNLDFHIKPPNDLMINSKKVSGVLLEVVQQGNDYLLIIGIGMNILSHPKEYEIMATNIQSECQNSNTEWTVQIEIFLETFYKYLLNNLDQFLIPHLSTNNCKDLNASMRGFVMDSNLQLQTPKGTLSWRNL
jgi:BirA family biotin operon repressor/biotin-[acetyl-CoA-carboxylase] ligase